MPVRESDGLVEIRLPKCLLVLTRGELLFLLSQDQDVWRRALERGKAILRQRQNQERGREHGSAHP